VAASNLVRPNIKIQSSLRQSNSLVPACTTKGRLVYLFERKPVSLEPGFRHMKHMTRTGSRMHPASRSGEEAARATRSRVHCRRGGGAASDQLAILEAGEL